MQTHRKILSQLKIEAKSKKKTSSKSLNQIYNDLATQAGYNNLFTLQQRVSSEITQETKVLDNFANNIHPILLRLFPPKEDYLIKKSVDWSELSNKKTFDLRPLDFLIYHLNKPILAIHTVPNIEKDQLSPWIEDIKCAEAFFEDIEYGFLAITCGYLEIFRKQTLLEWLCQCFIFCYHAYNNDEYNHIPDFDADPFMIIGWDLNNKFPYQIALQARNKLQQLYDQKTVLSQIPEQVTKSTTIMDEALTSIKINDATYVYHKTRIIGCNLLNPLSEYVNELSVALIIKRFLKNELQIVSKDEMLKIRLNFKPKPPRRFSSISGTVGDDLLELSINSSFNHR